MKPTLEEVLARRLRELAHERGVPISHVADRCGLAHSYFWQLLEAKASSSLAVLQRLAEALDVDPLALLDARNEATPEAHRKAADAAPRCKRTNARRATVASAAERSTASGGRKRRRS